MIQVQRLKKIINKVDELSKRVTLNDLISAATSSKIIFGRLNKGFKNASGAGITPLNNEIKHKMKVIKSLEKRGILLKRTTRKITGQERGSFNIAKPLMTAGLPH